MRALVFGDRKWFHQGVLFEVLDDIHAATPITVVIEGEAQGADKMGKWWARSRGIEVDAYPADWNRFGKAAGPIRNQDMLKNGRPHMGIGFHDDIQSSKGTKDMLKRLLKAGVPVRLFSRSGEVDLTAIPGL